MRIGRSLLLLLWSVQRVRARLERTELRDRILAGTCVAVSERGPRLRLALVLARSKVTRDSFYRAFGGVEECVAASLRDSLDQLLGSLEAGEDWPEWIEGHRSQAEVIAWGLSIDSEAIEAAIDRGAELLPLDRTTAAGVIGGIYATVAARLRAGRSLDPETVESLRYLVELYKT